jgi:hypothetical protein
MEMEYDEGLNEYLGVEKPAPRKAMTRTACAEDFEDLFMVASCRQENNMGIRAMLKRKAQEDAQKPEFDPEQLRMGVEVEAEHKDVADFILSLSDKYTREQIYEMIAKAHLREIKDYYTRLKKMEDEAKGGDGMEKEGQTTTMDYSGGGAFSNRFPKGHTITMQVPPSQATQYKSPQISGNIISHEGPGKYKVRIPGEQTMMGQATDALVIDDTYAKPDHINYPKVSTTSSPPAQPVEKTGTPY